MITQNEFMRRMKEMQSMQPGMSFYGEIPDSFNLIVNVDSPIIKKVLEDTQKSIGIKIDPINHDIKEKNDELEKLRKENESKKEEEVPVEQKARITGLESELSGLRKEEESIVADFGEKDKTLRQLIDLALLSNNMLKGEALNNFIKRSTSLL